MSAGRTFRKIIGTKLSTNFREATAIVEAPFPKELKPTELLVRNVYCGINASDINFSAGIYQPDVRPPFDCGFEALGEVVAVGTAVSDVSVGDPVVTQSYGAFSEYQVVPRRHTKRAPSLAKEWLPLDLSATTASIALQEVLRPQKGERAVVTAASGGTGQFAVQLLKRVYGCAVVGTCSSASKGAFLLDRLGCDGVVDYRACAEDSMATEGLSTAQAVARRLQQLYPRGVNVAYESVGGDLLEAVVLSLALRARILSIGGIAVYSRGSVADTATEEGQKPLPLRLLSRSATLHTFFLPHYAKHAPKHFQTLCRYAEEGVITSFVDPTEFNGVEGVYAALEYMYARKNTGKVVVKL